MVELLIAIGVLGAAAWVTSLARRAARMAKIRARLTR